MISVLIPCHNEKNTISEIVDRILKVKEIDIEIIIIDDNSKDGTKDIIENNLASKVSKVIYNQVNEGKGYCIKKGIKEVSYHKRFSGDWVKRLGDGTEESHQRMAAAIDTLWRFTFEFQETDAVVDSLSESGIIPDAGALKQQWQQTVAKVFTDATLSVPEDARSFYLSGREGMHTEHLGILLAEMQFLQRAYPDASW